MGLEKIISKEERTMQTLINTVRAIYSVLRKTEKYMAVQYDYIEEFLPKEIAFVSTQELVDMYPDLTPKEREYKIVKEKGAVFLMQVGKTLTNGERHDGRAPDYDDLGTEWRYPCVLSCTGYCSGTFFHGNSC